MLRGKILKRLTRFGLCFYLFSYCMAFTVCAEEYPALTPGGGTGVADEVSYDEAAFGEDADAEALEVNGVGEGEDESDEAIVSDDAKIDEGALVEEEIAGEGIGSMYLDSGEAYENSTYSGLHKQICEAIDDSESYYSVYLTEDVFVDNGIVPDVDEREGSVMIDARGYAFRGTKDPALSGQNIDRKNLKDLCSAFESVEIFNARFVNFEDSVLFDEFSEDGFELSLYNCTFENNTGVYGGAICSSGSYDEISIENCTFKNNGVQAGGGAIYLGSNGSIMVTNSSFMDNVGSLEGEYNAGESYGGAIMVNCTGNYMKVKECVFVNNTAQKGGAIYDRIIDDESNDGQYIVDKCSFIDNKVTDSEAGGAVYREYVGTEYDEIKDSVFLKNTQPEIVLDEVDEKAYISNFIGGNWYGGTVDEARDNGPLSTKPSILVRGSGEGVYNWTLINMERAKNNDTSIAFKVFAASQAFSDGTVIYYDYSKSKRLGVGDIFGCIGENITFSNSSFGIDYNPEWRYGSYVECYYGGVNGTIDQGKNSYSVTITDPMGNELLTRSYDKGRIGCDLDHYGNATVNRTSSAVLGDTFTYRAFTWVYNTAANGTLMNNSDFTGPCLANEVIHVFVNGKKYDDVVTDSQGFFNVTINDAGKYNSVRMKFTSDATTSYSTDSHAIYPKGYVSVYCYPSSGESNAVDVYLYSSIENVTEGKIAVYYTKAGSDEKKLFNTTDLEGYDDSEIEIYITDLNKTLDPGYYYFSAEYACDSGKYLNFTTPLEESSKEGVLVGPEGYTYTDMESGSDDDTLYARFISITPAKNGTLSTWYRPVSGTEKTALESWNMSTLESWEQMNYWGLINVSEIPDGDYVFGVDYNCPTGECMNSSCEKQFTLPIKGKYSYEDAIVSIAQGDKLQVKLGDPDFILNVTAENLGMYEGEWSFESSNMSVATVDDEGLVHPVGLGVTNITAFYQSEDTMGNASLLLTVVNGTSGGNGTIPDNSTTPDNDTIHDNGTEPVPVPVPAPVPVPVPDSVTNITLNWINLINNTELNATVKVGYPGNVTYIGSKYKAKDMQSLANSTYVVGNVHIVLNSTLLDSADPQFKFKDIKHAFAVTGKDASFTVKFKAKKGIAKEKKKQINEANKELKRSPVKFKLEQVDLTQAMNVTYELDKKGTKVKKLSLTVNGVKYNPKAKKDFTYEIGSDKIVIKGTGDYKNSLDVALKK